MDKNAGFEQITGLYAALLISVALILAPYLVVSTFSIAIYVCLVLFAYMLRMDKEPSAPVFTHTTYITRTFWISNIMALLFTGLTIGGMLLLALGGHLDTDALRACSGGDMGPCVGIFVDDNALSFKAASFVALGPSILYLLFRFARGFARARGEARTAL